MEITIKTEMAFGDFLRLACGIAHEVLQNIAYANKAEEYMQFTQWCWEGEATPTVEGILQWTALAKSSIYEKVGLDANGKPIDYEDEWDEEDEDEYVYTRDAEDVYC